MSKVVSFIILGGLVLAAIAVIDINGVNADQDTKFISISVLSKRQANYGVDDNLVTIPVVSVDILEDKVHDIESESSVQVIKYTSLPVEDNGSGDQDNNDAQSVDKSKDKNGNKGNGNTNQNMNNNGNSNSNAGNGNNNSNNGQEKEKEKEKETKPDKGNGSESKGTASDKPGKVK